MATKSIKRVNAVKESPVVTTEEPPITVEAMVEKPKKKVSTFESTDVIECESITAGELIMIGSKSGTPYNWNDLGDVTEVEYRDLVAAIRANSDFITKPYFIIKDDDFLDEFPKVVDIYNSLYSARELKSILRELDATELVQKISSLPEGAKTSVKHLASTMVENGTLDSVSKIKVLDEIFDTKLMLMTGLFED